MGRYDLTKFDHLQAMADNGDRDAQYRLGLHFATEAGDEGIIHAHMWFNIAATAGDTRARAERQELAELMAPAQIAAAQKQARDWLQTRTV